MIERKESPSSSSVALRERPTRRMPSRPEPMSAARNHACRKPFLGKSTASYSDGVMLHKSQPPVIARSLAPVEVPRQFRGMVLEVESKASGRILLDGLLAWQCQGIERRRGVLWLDARVVVQVSLCGDGAGAAT